MRPLSERIFPSKKFHEYIFDFIIIVFSIWLSITLDNKERFRDDREQERKTLESIRDDMISDTTRIQSLAGWNDLVQQAASIFITADTAGMTLDTLSFYFYILYQYNPYVMTVSAYEEMKQSGISELIQNKKLLRDIIDHYNIYGGQFATSNANDRDIIMQHIIPYIDEHFEGHANADADILQWRRGLNSIMQDYRFLNILQSGFILRDRTELINSVYLQDLNLMIDSIGTELEILK